MINVDQLLIRHPAKAGIQQKMPLRDEFRTGFPPVTVIDGVNAGNAGAVFSTREWRKEKQKTPIGVALEFRGETSGNVSISE